MSAFMPAFDFLMDSEDPKREFQCVPDNKGLVISGVNSLEWPDDFKAINALPVHGRPFAVAAFYQKNYWNPLLLAQINSQDIANRVLDQSVNGGNSSAVSMLQNACGFCGQTVTADGVMGPNTLAAVNACDPVALLDQYRQERLHHYVAVAAAHPEWSSDLAGWEARALR